MTTKPNRTPWIIVGTLGCLTVCLFAALVGGGIILLRMPEQTGNNVSLTSVLIPPPPGGGGVPLPPPPVDHGVTCLIEQEGAIFANAPDLHNYLSDDGGITWREAPRSGLPNGSYCLGRDKPWQLFATVEGQVQYRITPKVGIERSEDGGKTWKREVDLADESWQAKPQTGTPVKVEANSGPFDVMVHRPTGNLIAAMGHLGVLVRTPDGKWQWIRVGNYYRGDVASLSTPAPRVAANATPLPTPAAPNKVLAAHPQNSTNNSFGLAFSSDSQTLAMVGYDAVHLWRTTDWSQIRTVAQKSGRKVVQGIALSPDGQTLAYTEGSTDNSVQVWNTKDGALLRRLQGHTSWITSVAVSADGQTFATGASFRDPGVRLWRVSDGAPLRTLTGNPSGVTRIAFSPDGQLIAVDGPNRVWRIADGTALYTYEGGRRLPTLESGVLKNGSLAFSADSKSLLAVEGDTSMRVWNMSDGSLARTIMLPLPHGFDVQSAAFSSDRKLLATGLGDGTIWLWRLEDMTLLSRFTFNENWANVAELAFSPDGTLLAATSDSGNTVRLWGIPPGDSTSRIVPTERNTATPLPRPTASVVPTRLPSPTGTNLLAVPPLSQGIDQWQKLLQGGSRISGNNQVRVVTDSTYGKVIEFSRTAGGQDGGAAGLNLPLKLDVSQYPHLYVALIGRVLNEDGGNLANSDSRWFPEGAVQIRIKYLTAAEKESEWYHGFTAATIANGDANNFTMGTGETWFNYLSLDLKSLPNPPSLITELRVYGFGWNFQGQVADVSLLTQ